MCLGKTLNRTHNQINTIIKRIQMVKIVWSKISAQTKCVVKQNQCSQKKCVVQEKQCSNKISAQRKNLCSKKSVLKEKMCAQKKCVVIEKISAHRKCVVKEKTCGQKTCGQRKSVLIEKISAQRKCVVKENLCSKNLWSKNMCGQTCGQKISALQICALWRYPKCGQPEKKNVVKTRRYPKTCGQRKSLITCHTEKV